MVPQGVLTPCFSEGGFGERPYHTPISQTRLMLRLMFLPYEQAQFL